MTTYLVTGGAGFIGSNLVDELLRRGHRVRVLDNFSTGRAENLRDVMNRIELVEGDLRDADAVDAAVRGADFVLHQAALASVPRSIADPVSNNQVNVQGTLNLLVAAQRHRVKRVVYASSSSVYGDSEELPKVETMTPNPKSPYAVAKLAAEQYCRVFADLHGMTTISLRYFNVFGPRQDPTSQYSAVIPIFVRCLLQGKPPTVYGDGEQSRDLTFISNVVNANLLACGGRYTINQIFDALEARIGSGLRPRFEAPRAGDVKHSMADISRARRDLGYQPEVGFEDGIDATVRWYQEAGLKTLG
jgi:nucleoside-diphosphate-sugar epimerase